MRKLTYLTVLALGALMVSCGESKEGTVLEGQFADYAGQAVHVLALENNQQIAVDSTQADGSGNFELVLPVTKPEFYQLRFSSGQQVGIVVNPNEDISMELASGKQFPHEIVSEGSAETATMFGFYAKCVEFEEQRNALVQEVQALGNPPTDQDKQRALVENINQIGKHYYDYVIQYANEQAGSPAAFASLSKLNAQRDFEVYETIVEKMKPAMAHNGYFKSLSQQVETLSKQVAAQKAKKEIQERLKPGNEAPEIVLNDPEGNPVALSSLRGNYVLIDFWASWCRPCRAENPNVVSMYKKYNKKGFEIYSVSLDRTKDAWTKAIADDGLTWTHVSDLKFWNSEGAKTYGVSSIPFTVLIDKEGKVLASNIRGNSLRSKLQEIFGF